MRKHCCRDTIAEEFRAVVTTVLKIKLTMMAKLKADNGSTIFSLLFKKIPIPFAGAVNQTRDEIGLYVCYFCHDRYYRPKDPHCQQPK